MVENYNIPDVEPDAETGLSTWPVLAGTAIIGRVEETLSGYVPVRLDVMGLEMWRGPELPFRESAIEEIKKHHQH